MINRVIQKKLSEMVKKFPVIAITGPRQSGKTTLCRLNFPNYRYVSLETPDNREIAINDPRGFLELYDDKVIIDEIQNAPALFSYLQEHIDISNKVGQYILTGSQNFLLLENITQSLAGRIYICQLLPFSVPELKKFKFNLTSLIFKGSYPRVLVQDINPVDFYPSYIQTYIERDLRTMIAIKDLSLFISFLKVCAGRIGQLFNASAIANEIGVDYKTIQHWLSILEASYVIYTLKPWHVNFNKRLVKSPKIYFYDTGLVCNLLQITNENQIDLHYLKGALFENFIINEHVKFYFNSGKPFSGFFWRDSAGNEIDLLFEQANQLKVIEIKSSKTFKKDDLKTLLKFQLLAKNYQVKKQLIVGGTTTGMLFDTSITPWNRINKFM